MKRPFLKTAFLSLLISGCFVLPTKAALRTQCIQIDGQRFTVEVAQTKTEQMRGLQYRTTLAEDKGMIFPYASPKPLTFWMKDCNMPIDILFFNQGMLINAAQGAPPCNAAPDKCPVFTSNGPADMVVELRSGSVKKYGFSNQSHLTLCPH